MQVSGRSILESWDPRKHPRASDGKFSEIAKAAKAKAAKTKVEVKDEWRELKAAYKKKDLAPEEHALAPEAIEEIEKTTKKVIIPAALGTLGAVGGMELIARSQGQLATPQELKVFNKIGKKLNIYRVPTRPQDPVSMIEYLAGGMNKPGQAYTASFQMGGRYPRINKIAQKIAPKVDTLTRKVVRKFSDMPRREVRQIGREAANAVRKIGDVGLISTPGPRYEFKKAGPVNVPTTEYVMQGGREIPKLTTRMVNVSKGVSQTPYSRPLSSPVAYHEMGHAVDFKNKAVSKNLGYHNLPNLVAPTMIAYVAARDIKKGQDRPFIYKHAEAITAASMLPKLKREAVASIFAAKTLKKMGRPLLGSAKVGGKVVTGSLRSLAPAFGTYVAGAMIPVAIVHAIKKGRERAITNAELAQKAKSKVVTARHKQKRAA